MPYNTRFRLGVSEKRRPVNQEWVPAAKGQPCSPSPGPVDSPPRPDFVFQSAADSPIRASEFTPWKHLEALPWRIRSREATSCLMGDDREVTDNLHCTSLGRSWCIYHLGSCLQRLRTVLTNIELPGFLGQQLSGKLPNGVSIIVDAFPHCREAGQESLYPHGG